MKTRVIWTLLLSLILFLSASGVWADYRPPSWREGDVNGDDVVDIRDLVIIASSFGLVGPGDINRDGVVNILDLAIAAGNFDSKWAKIGTELLLKDESRIYNIDYWRLREAIAASGWYFDKVRYVEVIIRDSGNLPNDNSSVAHYFDEDKYVQIEIDTRDFPIPRSGGDIRLKGTQYVAWVLGHELGAFSDFPRSFEAEKGKNEDESISDAFAWKFLANAIRLEVVRKP